MIGVVEDSRVNRLADEEDEAGRNKEGLTRQELPHCRFPKSLV